MANVTTDSTIPGYSYTAGDTLAIQPGVTLTINATPTIQIGAITAIAGGGRCVITNSSTTTMLKLSFPATASSVRALNFEADGSLEISGGWITLYTGDGTANQTVLANLSSVGGASLDYLPYVEVEESTNVWERWVLVPEAVSGFENSEWSTPHYTTGTVTVTAGGAVTFSTALASTTTIAASVNTNKRFRATGMSADAVIQSVGSTTTAQLQNLDGSAYSGGAVSAGSSFTIKTGSCFDRDDFSTGSMGRVLFFNPVSKAISCGDGTFGNIIGNGMRVRCPNIFVGAEYATATTSTNITGTAAIAFTISPTTGFPTTNAGYTTTSATPTLLMTNGTVTERIGFTTISSGTVSATGQTRGAHYTNPYAFGAGTKTVKLIPNHGTIQCANYLDLSAGGKMSVDKAMFGPNFVISYVNSAQGFFLAKSLSWKNVGFFGGIVAPLQGPTGDVTLDGVVFNPDRRCVNGVGDKYGMNNVAGSCSIKNVVAFAAYDKNETTGDATCLSFDQNANLTAFENITAILLRHHNQSDRAIYLTSADGITVKNIRATQTVWIGNSSGSVFEKFYLAGSSGAPSTANSTASLRIGDYCSENIFREILNLESCAPMRTLLIETLNFSDGNIVTNKGFAAYDGKANMANTVFTDVGRNNTFAYFNFTNGRDTTTPIGTNAQNRGQRRIRILSDSYDPSPLAALKGPRPAIGSEIQIQMGPQPYNSGTVFDSQAFTLCTDPATASDAYLVCGPLFPDDQWSGSFSGLSTTAYLTGAGELYLKGASDSVTISSHWPIKGLSSFNSSGSMTTIGTSLTNMNYEFRLCKWGDDITSVSWSTPASTISMSAMESARAALSGYSTSVGLNIQVRVTTTATSTTRRFSVLRFPGTWDTALDLPVGSFNLRVAGAISGAQIAVSTDSGTTWPSRYMATSTGSTVTIPIDCDFLGATTNLKVRIRKAGYQVLEYDLTTVDQDVDLPVELVQVLDVTGSPVYGRGPGTTTSYISVVPASLRVDIGNILVVLEDLYDALAAWQSTPTGIAYPEVLQFDGTDSIMLNNWKLRRNVAGSTNAAIDGLVLYGPNTSLNPVDEANGSVQIWARGVRTASGIGISAADVWNYATASATTSGSMGERLKDASTVATNGQQLTAALS